MNTIWIVLLLTIAGSCVTQCPPGKFRDLLKFGACSSCEHPCINCSSQLNCSSCVSGYTLFKGITCLADSRKCDDSNCKSCPVTTGLCIECKPDYSLETSGCEAVTGGSTCDVPRCQKCDSHGKCIQCESGFDKIDGLPVVGTACLPSLISPPSPNCIGFLCQKCSSNNTKCEKCQDFFALNNKGACVGDFTNLNLDPCNSVICKTCSSDGKRCENCQENLTLEGNLCLPRTGNAINACNELFCQKCSQDGNSCEECQTSFSNSGRGLCVPEMPENPLTPCNSVICKTCSQDKKECRICQDNFRLTLGFCFPNVDLPTFCYSSICKTCSESGDKCLECQDKFTKNDTGLCIPKPDSFLPKCNDLICDECSEDEKSCLTCQSNFSLNGDGMCLPDLDSSTIRCNDQICEECSDETNPDEPKKCVECKDQFTLTNGLCIPTFENQLDICNKILCKECSEDQNSCEVCQNGFTKNNDNFCIPDVEDLLTPCNSLLCDNCVDDVCTKCKENLKKNGDFCTPDVGELQKEINVCNTIICGKCSEDGDTCLNCSEGYTKRQGICLPKFNSNIVPPGFGKDSDGTIVPCKSLGCFRCKNFEHCDQCAPLFLLTRENTCEADIDISRSRDCGERCSHCLELQLEGGLDNSIIPEGICIECQSGWIPSPEGDHCIKFELPDFSQELCQETVPGCEVCVDINPLDLGSVTAPNPNLKCQICAGSLIPNLEGDGCIDLQTDEFIESRKCFQKIQGCLTCTEEDICQSCIFGFEPDYRGLNCKPISNLPQRLECDSSVHNCERCIKTNQNNQICIWCKQGFRPSVDGQSCERLEDFMLDQCSENINHCTKCYEVGIPAFGLSFTQVCTECEEGRIPTAIGDRCINPDKYECRIDRCLACANERVPFIGIQQFCRVCESGYILNPRGTDCAPLPDKEKRMIMCSMKINGCVECLFIKDFTKPFLKRSLCLKCRSGLQPTLLGEACVEPEFSSTEYDDCSNDLYGCSTCILETSPGFRMSKLRCSKCQDGFTFNRTGGCEKKKNCSEIDRGCIECEVSEYNEFGSPVSYGCLHCSFGLIPTPGGKNCRVSDGKELDANSCSQLKNCRICVPGGEGEARCGVCELGFRYSSQSKECEPDDGFIPSVVKCSSELANCLNCIILQNSPVCLLCHMGFKSSEDNQSCQPDDRFNKQKICSLTFENCTQCQNLDFYSKSFNTRLSKELLQYPTCIQCADSFKPAKDNFGCILSSLDPKDSVCSTLFKDCLACENIYEREAECTQCSEGMIPSHKGKGCVDELSDISCLQKIPGCIDCEKDEFNELTCNEYLDGMEPVEEQGCNIHVPSEETCHSMMENCEVCSLPPMFIHHKRVGPPLDIQKLFICSQCSSGYKFSWDMLSCIEHSEEEKTCSETIPGCSICSVNFPEKCLKCQTGMELQQSECISMEATTYKTLDCILDNCEICEIEIQFYPEFCGHLLSPRICRVCNPGYNKVRDSCIKTTRPRPPPIIPTIEVFGCSKYHPPVFEIEAILPVCEECMQGFDLNDSGVCERQISEVLTCSETIESCQTCAILLHPITQKEVYFTCTQCSIGYYPDEYGLNCIFGDQPTQAECEDLMTKCSKCGKMSKKSEEIICYKCEPGFTTTRDIKTRCIPPEEVTASCDSVLDHCESCNITDDIIVDPTCQKCQRGFSLNSFHHCSIDENFEKPFRCAAIKHCERCDEITARISWPLPIHTRCVQCIAGFSLSENEMECIPSEDTKSKCIIPECEECRVLEGADPDQMECNVCSEGFFQSEVETLCLKDTEHEAHKAPIGSSECSNLILGCKECYQLPEFNPFNIGPRCISCFLPLKPSVTFDRCIENDSEPEEECRKEIFGCLQCKKVTVPGNDPQMVCLKCETNKEFKRHNRTCERISNELCPPGQFFTREQTCEFCSSSCRECRLNRDQCTACYPKNRLRDETCQPLCEEGFYLNTDNACTVCPAGCSSCKIINHYLTCTSCFGGYSKKNRRCVVCDTENGFFEFEARNQCRQCHQSCDKCEVTSKCSSCSSGLQRQELNGLCGNNSTVNSKADCQMNQFFHENKCYQCDPTCQTCNGPNSGRCLSCSVYQGLVLDKGECRCRPGFFFNQDTLGCEACFDSNCRECSGPEKGQCYMCMNKGFKLYQNICLDCSVSPVLELVGLFTEVCKQRPVRVKIMKETGIQVEAPNPLKSDFGVPERVLVSDRFRFELKTEDTFSEKELNRDHSIYKELFKIAINEYQEGKDFEINFKYDKEFNQIGFDIIFFVDTGLSLMTISIQDPGALTSNLIFDQEKNRPDMSKKPWDEESIRDELTSEEKEERKIQTLEMMGVSIEGTPEEQQELRRRRILNKVLPDGPILMAETVEIEIIGRKLPSQGQINFAKGMGQFICVVMICSFFAGLVLTIVKMKKKLEFHGHFIQLILLVEFISRSALINVNFGNLLTLFFDQIFGIDSSLMWSISSEEKLRAEIILPGKLNEYFVPVLVINSAPITLFVYLGFTLFNVIFQKNAKNKKIAWTLENIRFIIMTLALPDVIFYCFIEVKHNSFSGDNGTSTSKFSYILAWVGLLTVIWDALKLIYYSATQVYRVPPGQRSLNYEKQRADIYYHFIQIGWKDNAVSESNVIRSFNLLFFLRFFLVQIIIANFQTSKNFMTNAVIAMNIIYGLYVVYTYIKYRKHTESKRYMIQNIILEVLLFIFSILLGVFKSDPENIKFSSSKTNNLQLFMMFTIVLIFANQITQFVFGIILEVTKGKLNEIQAISEIDVFPNTDQLGNTPLPQSETQYPQPPGRQLKVEGYKIEDPKPSDFKPSDVEDKQSLSQVSFDMSEDIKSKDKPTVVNNMKSSQFAKKLGQAPKEELRKRQVKLTPMAEPIALDLPDKSENLEFDLKGKTAPEEI